MASGSRLAWATEGNLNTKTQGQLAGSAGEVLTSKTKTDAQSLIPVPHMVEQGREGGAKSQKFSSDPYSIPHPGTSICTK